MSIQVNPLLSPRIITIPEADGTEITIQSLVNQIRDWEDEQANLAYPYILKATGKEVLDTETLVGITATLINTKVKFADRTSPTDCDIYGGNLVAINADGYPMNAIQYATNVTVTMTKSSSATMVQSAEIDTILARIGEPTSTIASDLDYIESQIDTLPPDLSTSHGSGLWEKRRGIFK